MPTMKHILGFEDEAAAFTLFGREAICEVYFLLADQHAILKQKFDEVILATRVCPEVEK
jgi:hypothetical protein